MFDDEQFRVLGTLALKIALLWFVLGFVLGHQFGDQFVAALRGAI